MIRNYTNPKIYRNFKIVKILSNISLIISAISILVYTIVKGVKYGILLSELIYLIPFYFFSILVPLNQSLFAFRAPESSSIDSEQKEKHKSKFGIESTINNDFSNTLTIVIISFMPYIMLIFFHFLFACFGVPNPSIWAYFCGYMLPAHILAYIAVGFLIQNCVLIKREWKDNPPDFVKEQQFKKNQQKYKKSQQEQMKIYNQNLEQFKKLIEKCGTKFFIKYYKQIEELPLRDVAISENYTPAEREERLLAAKKLIDLGLGKFALNEILDYYSGVLDKEYIEQAKSLLAET